MEAISLAALNGLSPEDATTVVTTAFESYLSVENLFEGRILDDVVQELIKSNKANLQAVIDLNLAHSQLQSRNKLVLALLRQVETFSDRYNQVMSLPDDTMVALKRLAALKGQEYGEVVLSANSIIRASEFPSFPSRLADLRGLLSDDVDREELARSATLSAGVDLLSALFDDADEKIAKNAVEVYVRRVYRAHRIKTIDVDTIGGRLTCSWTFQFADTPVNDSPFRVGQMSVVRDFGMLKEQVRGCRVRVAECEGN